MFEIILIDLDNTLLDFNAAEEKAIGKTLLKYKVDPTDEVIALFRKINSGLWEDFEAGKISKKELSEKRFLMLWEKMGRKGGERIKKKASRYYLKSLSTGSDLMPNAEETISELEKICKIYPVTNGFYKIQRKRIRRSPLRNRFDKIYISEKIGFPKPEAGFFDYIFHDLKIEDKNKVLLVGDSLTADIKGGKDYGISVCWYNPKGEETKEPRPDYEIRDLLELNGLLLQNNQQTKNLKAVNNEPESGGNIMEHKKIKALNTEINRLKEKWHVALDNANFSYWPITAELKRKRKRYFWYFTMSLCLVAIVIVWAVLEGLESIKELPIKPDQKKGVIGTLFCVVLGTSLVALINWLSVVKKLRKENKTWESLLKTAELLQKEISEKSALNTSNMIRELKRHNIDTEHIGTAYDDILEFYDSWAESGGTEV